MAGSFLWFCVFLLLLLLRPTLSYAQANTSGFQRFGVEEGLEDHSIFTTFQDRTGFLWVGTQGTLYRYDGHVFRAFKPDSTTTLTDGFIYSINEDHAGNLWFGTRSGGLNKYDPRTERFHAYRHDSTDATTLSDDGVRAIHIDPTGRLWAGTRQGTLDAFDPETERFTHFTFPEERGDPQKSRDIFTIYEPPSEPGVLWIGRADGLYRFDMATQNITPYRNDPNDPSSLSDNTVFALFEDRNGTLWVGTRQGGLNRFDRQTESFTAYRSSKEPFSLSHDYITAIAPNLDHTFWVGTYGGGLNKFDPQTGRFTQYTHTFNAPRSLSHNSVVSLLLDRTGQLWVGTDVGLNKLNPAQEQFAFYGYEPGNPKSLSDAEVLCLLEDGPYVWIGTQNGGLNRLDRRNGAFRHYINEADSLHTEINIMFADHAGRLWVGSDDNHLYQFDRDRQRLRRHLSLNGTTQENTDIGRLQAIYESPGAPGTLWLGTSHAGLYRYDTRTGSVDPYYYQSEKATSLSHNAISQTYEDHTGVFWIATMGGGVNTFDADTESFAHFKHNAQNPATLSSNDVTAIAEDRQGHLWFGTFDHGLNKYDRATGRFTRYNQESGFPFSHIGGILLDDGGLLWLTSSRGLFMFDSISETYAKYGLASGFQGNLFRDRALFKGSNGQVYAGGINGFNIFHPDSLNKDYTPSATVLTNLLVNDQPIPLDSSITIMQNVKLDYDQNFLFFEFATLDFTAPSINQYRYILENEDNGWFLSGNRSFARYPNLTHGQYVFRVQGANSQGIWNEAGAALSITITPPWWRRWWFYTLVIMAVLGLITGAYRYRVAKLLEIEQVENQKRLELAQMRHQNELATEQMRMRIASDLHDELGGKLSGIAMLTDHVHHRATLAAAEEQRLRQVSDTARRMVDELRNIVWFITPEYDKLDNVVTKMQNVTATLLGEINHSFQYPEEGLGGSLDMEFRRHFLLCYQEILHNIVRHARASHVEVRLAGEPGRLLLSVADDGVGFDPAMVTQGNGLKNLRQRAARMQGAVHIESRPGEGTTLTLIAKTT